MYTPQPIKGTKIATGADVESIINASFCLEIRNLSVSGLKTGPMIKGVPKSEKNTSLPPTHAAICACQRDFVQRSM